MQARQSTAGRKTPHQRSGVVSAIGALVHGIAAALREKLSERGDSGESESIW